MIVIISRYIVFISDTRGYLKALLIETTHSRALLGTLSLFANGLFDETRLPILGGIQRLQLNVMRLQLTKGCAFE